MKYDASSRVFLTNFEVFGKVLKQRYNFSIGTKTKEKKKTKIVEISAKTIRYPNTVTIMIYRV